MVAVEPWARTLSALRQMVKTEAGLLLRYDQQDFIEVRLRETVRQFGHQSVHELVARAATSPEPKITRAVVEALTTHTTSFFREEHHFRTMIDIGVRDRPAGLNQFRVWSAACSRAKNPIRRP